MSISQMGKALCGGLTILLLAASDAKALHNTPGVIEEADVLSFTVLVQNPDSTRDLVNARLIVSSAPAWLDLSTTSISGPVLLAHDTTVYLRMDFIVTSTPSPQQAELILGIRADNLNLANPIIDWHFLTSNAFLTFTGRLVDEQGMNFGGYIFPDTAPPFTSIFFDTRTSSDDNDNLYISTVTMLELSSVDQIVPGAITSGIAFTGYQVDVDSPTFSELLPSSSPFSLSEGTHTVVYASSDTAGNLESLNTQPLRVDGTPPVTTFVVEGTSYAAAGIVYSAQASTHSLSATDPTVLGVAAGVALSSYSVDSGAWVVSTGPIMLAAGSHTVEFQSQDNVGNVETMHPLTVIVDTIPPSAVTSLNSLWPSTSDQITLNWTAPGNDSSAGDIPFGYFAIQKTSDADTVEWSTTSAVLISTYNVSPGSYQSHVSTGLQVETTYYFRLWTRDQSENWSGLSNGATVQTKRDNAPIGLTYTDQGISSVSWQWNGTGEFSIYYGTSPTVLITTTSENTFIQTGLSSNTAYSIAVATNDPAGLNNLAYSPVRYTLAASPTGLDSSAISSHTVSLVWEANTNPAWTNYRVSYSTSSDFEQDITTTTTGSIADTHVTLIGLAHSTTYYLRNFAVNGNDLASGFGNTISTVTLPPTPDQVTGLAAEILGVSSITWSWNAVTGATHYEVYPATGGTSITVSTPTTSHTKVSLATNTAYGVRVGAWNDSGEGYLSILLTTYTFAAIPAGLAATSSTIDSVDLAWDAQGNPASTVYEVSDSTDDFTTTLSTPFSFSDGLIASSATVSDLSAGTTYWFRVRAMNAVGIVTGFSNTVSTQTFPDVPSRIIGVPLGISSISWTWNAQPASGFKVYDVDGDPPATVSTNSYVTTGLSINSPYAISVSAYDGTGEGELSGPVTGYSAANPPTAGSAQAVSAGAVSATWGANSNPAGTQYLVLYSTNANLSPLSYVSSTSTSLSIGSLEQATTYYFNVIALSSGNFPTAFVDLGSAYTLVGGPNFVSGIFAGGGVSTQGTSVFPWAVPIQISIGQPIFGTLNPGTTNELDLGTAAALSGGP